MHYTTIVTIDELSSLTLFWKLKRANRFQDTYILICGHAFSTGSATQLLLWVQVSDSKSFLSAGFVSQ